MNKTALKERTSINTKYREIMTRFGKITVDIEKVINFPQGLLGIPKYKNYYLTAYPDENVKSYSLLQSTDSDKLCFLTLPLANEFYETNSSLLSNQDVMAAKEDYDIEHLAILLIATIHNNKKTKKSKISVNLKAPILLDIDKLTAYQHVFVRKEYPIQYFLN